MNFQLPSSNTVITKALLTALIYNTPFAIYTINSHAMRDGRKIRQDGDYMDVIDSGDDDMYDSLLTHQALQDALHKNPMLCATTMELSIADEYAEAEAPDDNLITFDAAGIAQLKQELFSLLSLLHVTLATVDADAARIGQYALNHVSTFSTQVHPFSLAECEATQVWLSLQNINNHVYVGIEVRSFFRDDSSQMESFDILLSIRELANLAFYS